MILKSEIEDAISEQLKYLEKKSTGQAREMVDDIVLVNDYVTIITGIRRCGKSTMMHQLSKTGDQKIAYLNFEDPRIFGFEPKDFSKIKEAFGDEINYYFFDEIQNVDKWEVLVRYLHDHEKTICVTGSNASLLSKELGTKLTGRNIQIELFPFSYKEYCIFKKTTPNAKSLTKYLAEGGFPDYVKNKRKEYLQQLFKDIAYRDIIVRYGIRNVNSFIDIALFLISNTAKEYSLTGIKKAFGIGSTNSVMNYVEWLEDAYVLFSVPRFSWSLKSVAINRRKIYTIDTAFATANSLSFSKDSGRLFENMIFLALRRKHRDIYYFREKGECDFVVKEGKKILSLIQVCTEVNGDNMDRELNGLLEAMDFFKKKEGVIVTLDQEDVIQKEKKTVRLIPAYKWLIDYE